MATRREYTVYWNILKLKERAGDKNATFHEEIIYCTPIVPNHFEI